MIERKKKQQLNTTAPWYIIIDGQKTTWLIYAYCLYMYVVNISFTM